jgi:uncharacterized protein YjbJ (UPF0337 family)
MDEKNRDLTDEGVDNRLKGTAKNVEGHIRSAVGGLTDDRSEQVKGEAQKLKGHMQDKLGKAEIDADN